MAVVDGSPVNANNSNNAWMSRLVDDDTVGKKGLKNTDAESGDPIDNAQRYINEIADSDGTLGEGDATRKDYASNEFIADGDSRKVAIEKLDIQLKITDDQSITNASDILALDGRLTTAEIEIQDIEDSIGQPDGIAELDSSGFVPIAQIPPSIIGGPSFVGTWNASTNTPALADGGANTSPLKGDYYRVSVAGTTLLDGISDWGQGDWVIFTGTVWDKIDNSEAVTSVNGATGTVTLDADDINETATRFWSVKDNRDAIVDPAPTNDSSEDYSIGSFWFNSISGTLFVCQDNSSSAAVWIIATGGGAGGGLDVFAIENYESTEASALSSGNNPTFGNTSSALQGTLADEESLPIAGDRSIKYTQAGTSLNDWVYLTEDAIGIELKQQGKLAKVVFYASYDGNDGDIQFIIEDQANTRVTGTSFVIKNGTAQRYETIFSVPSTATSLRFGFQVKVANNGAELLIDDIEFTLNTFTQEALQDENNFSAIITNNGTAAIQSQGGTNNNQQNAIASVTRSGLGRVDIVFTSNFFSVIPKIDVSIERTIDQNFGYGIESLTTSGCTIVTTRAVSFVDMDFHIGIQRQGSDYKGLNSNVITPARSNMLDYTEYTPSIQGCASVSNVNIFYKQIGDAYHILGSFTPTTLQAVEAQVSLPNGKAVKSGLNLTVCGTGSTAASTNDVRTMITGGDTFLNFANTSNAPQNGTPVFGLSGFTFSFEAMVPIEGLSSEAQFLAALPTLDVATTTEKILSADVTSAGDISDLTYSNLEVGNTYILTGNFRLDNTAINAEIFIRMRDAASDGGTLYTNFGGRRASASDMIVPVSFIFTATSTEVYFYKNTTAANRIVRGDGTKNETFLQLTDITSEFIKKAPKNRYGEKILSADVTTTGDVSDLQFNNLEIGKYYQLSGITYYNELSGETIVEAYSGANATGTLYGLISRGVNGGSGVGMLATTGVNTIFQAVSDTLYIHVPSVNNQGLYGNGTKQETYLQLEERKDLELTNNFD
jgi:hypothetical protein